MTKQEFNDLVAAGVAYFWNEDFSNIDLSGEEVRNINFESCRFCGFGTKLLYTTFHECTFFACSFAGADMTGADFEGSTLSGVTFANAVIDGMSFENSHHTDVDYQSAMSKNNLIW